jgi:catechol 2,3-dioxygenase-like lactoylglutathione lyase family enzyme
MFSHVMVGANDVAASKKFYDAVLGAIGIPEGEADPKGRIFYRTKFGVFGVTKPIDGKAATHANGGTIGFRCDSPEQVKAFHDAGVAAGAGASRILQSGAMARLASFTWRICAIHSVTRSAPFTALNPVRRTTAALSAGSKIDEARLMPRRLVSEVLTDMRRRGMGPRRGRRAELGPGSTAAVGPPSYATFDPKGWPNRTNVLLCMAVRKPLNQAGPLSASSPHWRLRGSTFCCLRLS